MVDNKRYLIGNEFLSDGEFTFAIDEYKYILENSPKDFRALRGLMLCAARLKNIEELLFLHKGLSKDFTFDTKLANEAVEGAVKEDREYFENWEKIYSDTKKLSDSREEIESLRNKKIEINDSIKYDKDSRSEYYIRTKLGFKIPPLISYITGWIFIILFGGGLLGGCIMEVVGGKASIDDVFPIAVIFGIVIFILITINQSAVFPNLKKIKELNNNINNQKSRIVRVEEKIRKLETETDELTAGIKTSVLDFIKKDRELMSDKT